MSATQNSMRILARELEATQKEKWTHVELINDDIYNWSVALIVLNPDSLYYGGYFKAKMHFPKNYPYSPPDFKFIKPLYHPNIYPDGRLCISILHAPGDDEMSGETAAERWSPVQTVESVLLSILSLLDDAEVSSPANVDASVMLRNDPAKYKEMVRKDLEASKKDIPAGFVMPTHESAFRTKKPDDDFDMSWEDSDEEEEDWGGSDSDDEEEIDSDFGGMDDDDEEEEDDDVDVKRKD
jgi:ubiquitin-conjugating enzyme E2 R